MTVTVTPVNDLPRAADDSFETAINTSGNLLDVLGNDTSLPDDGETLTIAYAGFASNGGTVSVVGGQQLLYTPAAGFSGQETFFYWVNDGTAVSYDWAQVTVTVLVADDSFTVAEDSGATVFDVLANDLVDPETTLTITSAGAASQGGFLSIVNGTAISYQPAADFYGTETFTYTVNDGTPGNDSTARVTVTVTPVNDLPRATDDSFDTAINTSGNLLDVLVNDTSLPDAGETLTIIGAGFASNGGTVSVVGGQQILYTPAAGFTGQEIFYYIVTDGTSGSYDWATVTVTVSAAAAAAPTVGNDSITVGEKSAATPSGEIPGPRRNLMTCQRTELRHVAWYPIYRSHVRGNVTGGLSGRLPRDWSVDARTKLASIPIDDPARDDLFAALSEIDEDISI